MRVRVGVGDTFGVRVTDGVGVLDGTHGSVGHSTMLVPYALGENLP